MDKGRGEKNQEDRNISSIHYTLTDRCLTHVFFDSAKIISLTVYLSLLGSLNPDLNQGEFMKPRISVLTIGVNDLENSMNFYKGLGLETEGIVGKEFERGAVVFFNLKGGLTLALYPRKDIAWDAKVSLDPHSATEFTIAHNVNSKDEVDLVMKQAGDTGAKIVKPAQNTFWGGYAGYFQDPDGHLWEVAWNPQRPVEE
jgi:predicted lactoylglutathione lyase